MSLLVSRLFYFTQSSYTIRTDNLEAKDMATKKKQVEQPANDELQQILEHFGENSAEYAEAKAKAEKE